MINGNTYDRNTWRENKPTEAFAVGGPEVVFEGYEAQQGDVPGARDHMDALSLLARAMGVNNKLFAQRVHGVGTAALFVEAEVHRAGAIFPETYLLLG